MTLRDEICAHLEETGESMRALSLRSGLGAKNVSDILRNSDQKPRYVTLAALSQATGRDLVRAAAGSAPLTYDRLIEKLKLDGRNVFVSRIRWIMRKENWYATKVVCRHDVIDFFAKNNAVSLELSAGSRSTYKSDILAAIDGYGERNRPRGVADIGGVWAECYQAALDADMPLDCIRKAGPFFVYLFDRRILPQHVTTDVLASYFAYRLETGVTTEEKCRKHIANVVTLISHFEGNARTANFGFRTVVSPFTDRRDKFGVDIALFAELMEEFDNRVTPWATGESSRDGVTYEQFLRELDEEEAAPVSDKKARLRKSVAAKSKLARKGDKKERVERKEAKLRKYGFLVTGDRWSHGTVSTRRGYVVSLAKALAASHDEVVTSMAELLDPEYLTAAAEAMAESNGGVGQTDYVASVLKTMKKVAAGYLAVSEENLEEIRALIRFHETGRRGMAPKNQSKLRKFTEVRIQSTIDLSGTVLRGINAEIDRKRKRRCKTDGAITARVDAIDIEMARDIAAAVAHSILIARAPRSANVIGARLNWIAFQDGIARITVPNREVKGRGPGDPDYVVKLGERASRLLRQFIESVRPILLQEGDKNNSFLFPRQPGGEFKTNKPYGAILKRVTRLLEEHVGVLINPHLYRHLIGWIWLKESMDNLPRVQRLLGHVDPSTTVKYYAELDENLVMDGWQNLLEEKQRQAA